jgi:hypothetical protein
MDAADRPELTELVHLRCMTATLPGLVAELALVEEHVERLPCGTCREDAPLEEWSRADAALCY